MRMRGRIEVFRGIHRDLESLKMRRPRLGDLHLADRRADADDRQAIGLEFGFDFGAKGMIEIQYIFSVDAASSKWVIAFCLHPLICSSSSGEISSAKAESFIMLAIPWVGQ